MKRIVLLLFIALTLCGWVRIWGGFAGTAELSVTRKVTLAFFLLPSVAVTVILTFPGLTNFTTPLLLTVATFVLLLAY